MQIYNTTLPEALAYKQKSFYKKKIEENTQTAEYKLEL